MVPPPDIEAQILRSYHAEKWRVGTIAGQLHVHHSGAYLPVHLARRRDNHAVVKQIVTLGNYLAPVHADAQPQGIRLRAQPLLDGD